MEEVLEYRFNANLFTEQQAKAWLSERGIKYSYFLSATKPHSHINCKCHDRYKPAKNSIESYLTILNRIADLLQEKKKVAYDFELFTKINQDIQKSIKLAFHSKTTKNVVINAAQERLYNSMEMSLYQFSAAKTSAELATANELFRASENLKGFKEDLNNMSLIFNNNYLRTEYNTAYATALSSSKYLDKKEDFKYAIWRQIDRETAREEHEVLDGICFLVDELDEIPPVDWNCGCDLEYTNNDDDFEGEALDADGAQELFESIVPTDKNYDNYWEQMKDTGFAQNNAQTGEIFDNNKIYNGVPKVTAEEQDLAPLTKFNPEVYPEAVLKSDYQSKSTLSDYLNRKLEAGLKPYSEMVENTVSHPDEVFINDKGAYTYIKYFKNEGELYPMMVEAKAGAKMGTFEIDKFGKMTDAKMRDKICILKHDPEIKIGLTETKKKKKK